MPASHGHEQDRRGFTLIELLAAMTILTVMVLLISKVFVESSNLWKGGEKRIQAFADGRAVVEFMTTELGNAIADKRVLRMKLNSDARSTYGGAMKADELYFVTAENQPSSVGGAPLVRQGKEVCYSVAEMKNSEDNNVSSRYRIMRYLFPTSNSSKARSYSYENQTNWVTAIKGSGGASGAIAENVRTLEFWVYDTNGVSQYNYDSFVHGPPSRVEIYIEMLGEDDSIKASLIAQGSGTAADEFCTKRVRRYVGRAYPQFTTAYTE